MKTAVKILTVIALLLIMFGGSALDSEDLTVPVLMLVPSFIWLGMIAWANRA